MDHRQPGRAPDFTNAALTMLGVNLIWVFVAIWLLWGFLAVMLIAIALNHMIERLAVRRGTTPIFGWLRIHRSLDRDPQA